MSEKWTIKKSSRPIRQSDEPRCDAFTSWTFKTGYRDSVAPGAKSKNPKALWLMLRLRPLGDGQSPPEKLLELSAALPDGWLRLPEQYAQPLRNLVEARHCTALASPKFIRYLVDGTLGRSHTKLAGILELIRSRIEAFEIGLQASEWNECAEAKKLINKAKSRPKSVIGVIDDGLPFAHHRLSWNDRGRRRTRFLALWDQSDNTPADRRWCLGRILDSDEMDKAIVDGSSHGRVDDDAVYHRAGTATMLRHRVTHGAHVLDLACGAEPPSSQNESPAIIGVQLRPMESTLCLSPGAHLFDAIRFVVAQADAACGDGVEPCPITINASVGNIAGPHDGHSIFEEAADELLSMRRKAFPNTPIDLVLPAGNSHLSRCHAWSEMESDTQLALDWHLRPDDGTSSYLEIWFRPVDFEPDKDLPDLEISVVLTTPSGKQELPVTLKQPMGAGAKTVEATLRDERKNCIAVVGLHPQPANGRYWMALVTIAPTAAYGPWEYVAPAGAWNLTITVGETSAPVYCNVYSQRDDKSFGHKGWGRQAVLEDKRDRVYDNKGVLILRESGKSFRRRVGTVNGLATGKEVIVAGGLVVKPGGAHEPALYSSAAIPQTQVRSWNRFFAVTEDSPVLHGLHAAGTRSGTIVTVSGTSMAAPQLARDLFRGILAISRGYVVDYDLQPRPKVLQAADLMRRSKRRRGESPDETP